MFTKVLLFITLSFIIASCVSSYDYTDFKIDIIEESAGKNLLTQEDILQTKYVYPTRIYDYYIDTTTNSFSIQLRALDSDGRYLENGGIIIVHDIATNKRKWWRKINYSNGNIIQGDSIFIREYDQISKKFGSTNGKTVWRVKNNIFYINSDLNIGIGYRIGRTNKFEGINLTNGEVIWQRTVERNYSHQAHNYVQYLNDSTIFYIGKGLFSINLKTGEGWGFKTKIGISHYLSAGAYSNIIVDTNDIYFASTYKLARLDKKTGKSKWKQKLPFDTTSKSIIFIKDTTLFFINTGWSALLQYNYYYRYKYGVPYFAAYNTETGQEKYFTLIGEEKTNIRGYNIIDDNIFFLFKDKVSKYSMISGELLKEKVLLPF